MYVCVFAVNAVCRKKWIYTNITLFNSMRYMGRIRKWATREERGGTKAIKMNKKWDRLSVDVFLWPQCADEWNYALHISIDELSYSSTAQCLQKCICLKQQQPLLLWRFCHSECRQKKPPACSFWTSFFFCLCFISHYIQAYFSDQKSELKIFNKHECFFDVKQQQHWSLDIAKKKI